MKRIFALLLALALAAGLSSAAFALEEEDLDMEYYTRFKGQNISINVYNWGEYISDGSDDSMNVNKEFEELTGIKVNYTNFATNEELYAKLKTGGVSYDVIIPSDYMVARMINEGMLSPINFDNVPNFKHISEEFKYQPYDPENLYSVPYTWGVVGIIYNTTLVDESKDMETWDILWDADYAGEILMFSHPRDAFGIALKKCGYSMNPDSTDQLREATEALKDQKYLVQAYVMDEIFDKMTGGEAAIAPYYAGDAVTMIDDNPDLAFAIPREGTNRFLDAMCIPKEAKNKEAAEMYINFMCEPEVGAANAEYIGYSSPNDAAFELLDEETQESPIIYPSDEVIEKSEFFNELPTEINLAMDKMWTEVLSNDEQYSEWFIPILLVVCIGLSIAINVVRTLRRKRESRNY